MAIRSHSNSLSQRLMKAKSQVRCEVNQVSKIKLAIEAMLSLQQTQDSNPQVRKARNTPQSSNKRPSVTPEQSPVIKRQCIACTDEILDQVAEEVSEVSEWALILANWNPEEENLFRLLDRTLVKPLT